MKPYEKPKREKKPPGEPKKKKIVQKPYHVQTYFRHLIFIEGHLHKNKWFTYKRFETREEAEEYMEIRKNKNDWFNTKGRDWRIMYKKTKR